MDIFTFHGQDYLITVDYLSGYFEVARLQSKRIKDVIYTLRIQFSTHGIPTEVVSDNSPFGAAEFTAFAERWEFKHTTSSPRYPQSNGRAENAVKTAKHLMIKATESGSDPLLALLDWRNTPSEQLGLSPAQLRFDRRTRTRLPTADALLSTPASTSAKRALTEAKRRQASYYDRGARRRPTLPVGQTVRVRYDESDWRKAEVARVLPHRSYDVRFEDGSTLRRTSRHVRFSSEPPIVIKTEAADDDAVPAAVATPPPNVARNEKQMPAKVRPPAPPNKSVTVTRSGRAIKLPARFKD